MKKLLPALLALLLLLSACGSGSASVTVYRAVAPNYRSGGPLLRAEQVSADPGIDIVNSTIAAFNSSPMDQELSNPLPQGTEIVGYSLKGSLLTIQVSPGYAALTGMDLTVANSCIVMTFCGLADSSRVSVQSGQEEFCPPMSADDIVLSDISA